MNGRIAGYPVEPPTVPDTLRELGRRLAQRIDRNSEVLAETMAVGIPGLPSDPTMRRLLHDSVRTNLETAARVYLGDLPLSDLHPPSAALDYARRLAQLEAPPNALARAYQWGQFMTTQWAVGEFAEIFADPATELAALRDFNVVNFWYIDHISELVLAAYQDERDRWLAHRRAVRSEVLLRIIGGGDVPSAEAEASLSYRIEQTHLAAVIWTEDNPASGDLSRLEGASARLAAAARVSRQPLFWASDPTTAWVWLPWKANEGPDVDGLRRALTDLDPHLRIALGSPGRGLAGFRESHADAALAALVRRIADNGAPAVVAVTDAGVRAAALLSTDLDGTARLVAMTLGQLARDTPTAAGLRDTLRVFLDERGSHTATARRLHVHKNTVGYRLTKAKEAIGGPIDADPASLHLALVACQWLGPAVLSR